MSTPIVERPRGRPSPCHKCGLVQGWKNLRCLNPDCAVLFRKPASIHTPRVRRRPRALDREWITRKAPPVPKNDTPPMKMSTLPIHDQTQAYMTGDGR